MGLVPVGPFRHVNLGGSGPFIVDPRVGPSRSSLELYINSMLGLDSVADTATFSPWPDFSGHGRDATAIVGQQAIMERTDPLHTSANGNPGVAWVGADSPFGSLYGNSLPNPMPSYANGYTIAAYGRFKPAFNTFGFSQVWQNQGGTGPQCWYEDNSGGRRYGFRDNAGNHFGAAFGLSNVYGLISWRFFPPNDGTGVSLVQLNGSTQLQGTWHETDGAVQQGYIIGANQVDNGACFMDLFALAWWSVSLSDQELSLYRQFWQHQFG